MTREEAIENLRRLQNLLFNDPYIDTSTIIATCNIAIEALEQQPCIQEKQANADKIDAVYIDGFKAGYSQARFDLEQEPCDDWHDVPSDEMTLEQARQAVKDLRKKLAECLKQEPCESCCDGNQEEKAKLCQKSYLAGMEHKEKQQPCEDAISRSEAIRVASGYCHWTNIPDELAKLPSVSTEKTAIDCSDSICRADAIKLVKSYIHEIITESGVDKNSHTNKILTDIVESLAFELPPVSTEKTGRWEWVQYDSNPNIGNWHCSECRNIVFQCVEKKGIHNEVIYKFCPWCGAKMEVEE